MKLDDFRTVPITLLTFLLYEKTFKWTIAKLRRNLNKLEKILHDILHSSTSRTAFGNDVTYLTHVIYTRDLSYGVYRPAHPFIWVYSLQDTIA